jgi:hypothetical protein
MAQHYDQVSATSAEHFAKASSLMAGAKEEILAFSGFPREQPPKEPPGRMCQSFSSAAWRHPGGGLGEDESPVGL